MQVDGFDLDCDRFCDLLKISILEHECLVYVPNLLFVCVKDISGMRSKYQLLLFRLSRLTSILKPFSLVFETTTGLQKSKRCPAIVLHIFLKVKISYYELF